MKYRELVNEMIWDDRFEAAKQARRYPRAWIHFGNINKIGVNPSKGHRDPPGIYFYPIRFLFSAEASLSQYATEYAYYFICRFKRNANIINLGKLTMDEALRIAAANGWIDTFREVIANPKMLADQKVRVPPPRAMRRPGGLFYMTLDYLANVENKPWLPMLRGCHGIYDPGYGIISGGETAQAVVFGRQWFDVLQSGENIDHENREYANIIRKIAEEVGGKFYFMNKVPTIEAVIDGKPIKVEFMLQNGRIVCSYFHRGFWVQERHQYSTYNDGGWDNAYRELRYYVTSTAKKADPSGKGYYWNGDRVAETLHKIGRARLNQRVEDDGLHVWGSNESLGRTVIWLVAVVGFDDVAKFEFRIDFDYKEDLSFTVGRSFAPGTPPVTIANELLDEMTAKLRAALPNPEAAGNLLKRLGIHFGDRL